MDAERPKLVVRTVESELSHRCPDVVKQEKEFKMDTGACLACHAESEQQTAVKWIKYGKKANIHNIMTVE